MKSSLLKIFPRSAAKWLDNNSTTCAETGLSCSGSYKRLVRQNRKTEANLVESQWEWSRIICAYSIFAWRLKGGTLGIERCQGCGRWQDCLLAVTSADCVCWPIDREACMCMRDIDTLLRDVHYVALSFKFFFILYSVNNMKITQRVDWLFEPDKRQSDYSWRQLHFTDRLPTKRHRKLQLCRVNSLSEWRLARSTRVLHSEWFVLCFHHSTGRYLCSRQTAVDPHAGKHWTTHTRTQRTV